MNGMQGHSQGDAAWHREQNGVETFESVLLQVRKALCGNIHNPDDIVEMAAKIVKQRDELLAALEKIADTSVIYADGGRVNVAREAIASVKEGL